MGGKGLSSAPLPTGKHLDRDHYRPFVACVGIAATNILSSFARSQTTQRYDPPHTDVSLPTGFSVPWFSWDILDDL